ncbi:hypothetical protein LY474_17895 [Myxococcus stipitatus]|uniref:hypothetical protein n=1 Tax=Myxococcus stipitatus TaxID=83455 RepID=UPI001F2245FA|nr:hypothetical protein [Myxococcus stipitatus]MCE9669671.1 hypothetical protein [Myxococcus stipitatus]
MMRPGAGPRLYVGEPNEHTPLPFPREDRFRMTWAEILVQAAAWRSVETGPFLAEFCGEDSGAWRGVHDLVEGVHHVAFYLGDYDQDSRVFDWFDFLKRLLAKGALREASMGPSYIAPRQYGTPGWWYSVTLDDGFVIEMFCCRAYGTWTARAPRERVDLMSHLALAIKSEDAVRVALDQLALGHANLEAIAFTERDALGHTYGHVRNNRNHRVVELVHQGQPASSEVA